MVAATLFMCRYGHLGCSDHTGGPCTKTSAPPPPQIIDRQPLGTIDDYCACGGELRAIGARTEHGFLFECDRCRRRVYGS